MAPQPDKGGGNSWWLNLFGPIGTAAQSFFEGASATGTAAGQWLGGLGGDIGSGIEGGFIAVLRDVFKVLLPWLEVVAGALIITFTLLVYFREQTTKAAVGIGRAAVA